MAKDHSSDQRQEDNSSNEHDEEKNNSCEENNSSDDESEEYNPKASTNTIKKRKAFQTQTQNVIKNEVKKRKVPEEDDRDQTLQVLLQRLTKIAKEDDRESNDLPADSIIDATVAISFYSNSIFKQLTESDVNGGQSRLMLGKKEVTEKFFSFLDKAEIQRVVEGINVLVYGRDKKAHEMKFKMWNQDTPVLMNGWSKFVRDYKLQMYKDVVRIWMVREFEVGTISFAIDLIRVEGITKQLSKRILKEAFKN